jgi:hypothetical protein
MERARTEGRQIVEAMHDSLPLELCEYVYSHLVPEGIEQDMADVFSENFPHIPGPLHSSGVHGVNDDSWFPPPPPPPPPPPLPPNIPPFPYPHIENVHPPEYIRPAGRIFSSKFISESVALEAAKKYYQWNTFKVTVHCQQVRNWRTNYIQDNTDSQDGLVQHSLQRLLTVDRFSADLEPFSLIRKLCLLLPAECCNWHRGRHAQGADAEELRRLTLYRDELVANLALLPMENRHRMEFTFVIILRHRSQAKHVYDERYLLNMLSTIRNIVYDLREHGSRVMICAKLRRGERVDISELFPLSGAQLRAVCSFFSNPFHNADAATGPRHSIIVFGGNIHSVRRRS